LEGRFIKTHTLKAQILSRRQLKYGYVIKVTIPVFQDFLKKPNKMKQKYVKKARITDGTHPETKSVGKKNA